VIIDVEQAKNSVETFSRAFYFILTIHHYYLLASSIQCVISVMIASLEPK